MDPNELEKDRREVLRWRILQATNISRPFPLAEDTLFQTVAGIDMPITEFDLRRELDYLEARKLLEIDGRGSPKWYARLTRYGVDVAEYTLDCEPGIARPVKYW